MRQIVVAGTLFVAAASAVALAQTPSVQKYPYVSGPVTIVSCSVDENTSNRTVSPFSLRIKYYVNESNRSLTSVTFRVRYGEKAVDVTDSGTFYVKRPVALQFNLFSGLPWKGRAPAECRVAASKFDDRKTAAPDATDNSGAAPVESATPAASPEATSSAPAPTSSDRQEFDRQFAVQQEPIAIFAECFVTDFRDARAGGLDS